MILQWLWKCFNWPITKTRPLSYCCYVRHAALTPHIMFSRSGKQFAEQRGNWQHANRQDRAGYFWYETKSQLSNFKIQTLNIVSWLFNVSWEISVVPQFKWHIFPFLFNIFTNMFTKLWNIWYSDSENTFIMTMLVDLYRLMGAAMLVCTES